MLPYDTGMSARQLSTFWNRVEKTEGCWLWRGSRTTAGYGNVRVGPKNKYAHRLAWELTNGAIPNGLHVCHRCDNPPCVRPDHLFLGTGKDNARDSMQKGRHSPPPHYYGDEHHARKHPEWLARGERNGARTHPERVARGDRHSSKTHPERVARGERHGMHRLTEAQVLEIRARYAAGETSRQLAEAFGLNWSHASEIALGKSWKHLA